MNITYLLGAGASYHAIPIVGELEKTLEEVKFWASEAIKNPGHFSINTTHINGQKKFNSVMETAKFNANLYGTIDTFAKKLTISGSSFDLSMLKAALSIFFTVWQESSIKNLTLTRIREEKFSDLDSRYLGLLTNCLSYSNGNVKLYDNVKFITWNYDTQLERALATILDKDLNNVLENYNIYPYQTEKPSIVHLNGIAGLYKKDDNPITMFHEKNPLGSENRYKLLNNLFPYMESIERRSIQIDPYFSFAWEENPISKKAIEHAMAILNSTDILIVVGYSFPTFNNEIDQTLFKSLKNSGKNFKIFYQDKNANKNLISQRFDIPEDRIEADKENLRQFMLPLDSTLFKQEWTFH
jgi:hypothetical protein